MSEYLTPLGTEVKKVEPIADFGYAHLAESETTAKQSSLESVYRTNFPGATKPVKLKAGYFFFPEFHQRIANGRDFRDAYDEASNPAHFQFPDTFKEQIKSDVEVLSQEYKIHLMPKLEFVPFILDILIKAMKNDPEFFTSISQIKVLNSDKKERDGVMPTIVIYTQLGKPNAQLALNKIYQHLSAYDDLGTAKVPRYNQKVNNLIYYAQSGGDFKNDYLHAVKMEGRDVARDGIFDEDLIHFKGDYKLDLPTAKPAVKGSEGVRQNPIDRVGLVDKRAGKHAFETIRSPKDISPSDQQTIEEIRTRLRQIIRK